MSTGFTRVEVKPSLREIRAKLRALDTKLPKGLQKANKRAAERIAPLVRTLYGTAHSPVSGRGARSIRGTATQTRAQVAIGGKKAQYLLGQNFGRTAGGPKQFRTRPAGGDYFLYRTVERETPRLIDMYFDDLDDVMRAVYPKGGASQ